MALFPGRTERRVAFEERPRDRLVERNIAVSAETQTERASPDDDKLRDFRLVWKRLYFIDVDRPIPLEYKKVVLACAGYRTTVSKTSGETGILQTNPFQINERWSYHRYFDNDLYIQIRKIYLSALSARYVPSFHSSLHLVRSSSFFRDMLRVTYDSAEVHLPIVYHRIYDDSSLASLDIALPLAMQGPNHRTHLILDIGELASGRISAILSRYRGIARVHAAGRLSLCCATRVHTQELFIFDSCSSDANKAIMSLSTCGTKPDMYACKDRILDFVCLRSLTAYFPLDVPGSILAQEASVEGRSEGGLHPLMPFSIEGLMQHKDAQLFFLEGAMSQHSHVRFFAEAFRKMLRELRVVGAEDAFRGFALESVLQQGLGSMLALMRKMTGGGDRIDHFLDLAHALKSEINIILVQASPYTHYDRVSSQEFLLPQLNATLPETLSMPRFYYDISGFNSATDILVSLWHQRGERELGIVFNHLTYFEFGLRYPERMVHLYDPVADLFKTHVPPHSLDLFVVEPHRNYSNLMLQGNYVPEDIIRQVDSFYDQGLVRDRFCVIIDNTIDYIASDPVSAFVRHNRERIASGRMAVLVLRSAQKYDMLGFDDFQGGVVSVYCNDSNCFDESELRFIHDTCVQTPTFQGVTFYQRATREEQDRYRRIIFTNNRIGNDAFKRELGNPATLTDYHKFPLKVMLAEDDTLCCIDFRADNEQTILSFVKMLGERGFVQQRRPNFGFAMANWFIWTDFEPPRSFGRLSLGFNTAQDIKLLIETWVCFNKQLISGEREVKEEAVAAATEHEGVAQVAVQSVF